MLLPLDLKWKVLGVSAILSQATSVVAAGMLYHHTEPGPKNLFSKKGI